MKQDGKHIAATNFPLPLAKLTDDVYVYARSLSLAKFPVLGSYTLEFELIDPVSEGSFERLVDLELTD